eukprot:scaffold97967_cov19-Tisochrysis_lutea.AAC.1
MACGWFCVDPTSSNALSLPIPECHASACACATYHTRLQHTPTAHLEAGAVLLHDGRQLYLSRPDFLHAHGFIKTIAFALRRVGREARASRHKAVKDHMHHAQGTVVAFEFKQACEGQGIGKRLTVSAYTPIKCIGDVGMIARKCEMVKIIIIFETVGRT